MHTVASLQGKGGEGGGQICNPKLPKSTSSLEQNKIGTKSKILEPKNCVQFKSILDYSFMWFPFSIIFNYQSTNDCFLVRALRKNRQNKPT